MAVRNRLQKIYDMNPDTGNYLIQVLVDGYDGIFSNLDNAPLNKRDINPDIKEFLFDCSMDIPFRYDVDIKFNFENERLDESKEEIIKESFRTYCSFYMVSSVRHLKRLYGTSVQYFIISFFLLFGSFLLESTMNKSIIYDVLIEGIRIGGWVFLWQAILFLISQRSELLQRIKILKRLLKSHIYFQYGKE